MKAANKKIPKLLGTISLRSTALQGALTARQLDVNIIRQIWDDIVKARLDATLLNLNLAKPFIIPELPPRPSVLPPSPISSRSRKRPAKADGNKGGRKTARVERSVSPKTHIFDGNSRTYTSTGADRAQRVIRGETA
jgi:hypothetical protein